MHNYHYIQMYARTNFYKFILIPDVKRLWNILDQNIIDSSLNSAEPTEKFVNMRLVNQF